MDSPERSLPAISLIVPTRHRTASVRRLLDSLARQTFLSFEIVLVDDSDHGQEKHLAGVYPQLKIHYVRSSFHGANRARNLGLEKARGGIMYFLDDDTVLDRPDHLHNLFDLFNQHQGPVLIGGGYRSLRGSSLPQRIYNATCNLWLEKGVAQGEPILLGGNMSLRRQDLRPQIRFNETVFNGGDEIFFHQQFRQAHPKAKIRISHQLSVLHDAEMSWSRLFENSSRQQSNNPTTSATVRKWLSRPSASLWLLPATLIYILAGKLHRHWRSAH